MDVDTVPAMIEPESLAEEHGHKSKTDNNADVARLFSLLLDTRSSALSFYKMLFLTKDT